MHQRKRKIRPVSCALSATPHGDIQKNQQIKPDYWCVFVIHQAIQPTGRGGRFLTHPRDIKTKPANGRVLVVEGFQGSRNSTPYTTLLKNHSRHHPHHKTQPSNRIEFRSNPKSSFGSEKVTTRNPSKLGCIRSPRQR